MARLSFSLEYRWLGHFEGWLPVSTKTVKTPPYLEPAKMTSTMTHDLMDHLGYDEKLSNYEDELRALGVSIFRDPLDYSLYHMHRDIAALLKGCMLEGLPFSTMFINTPRVAKTNNPLVDVIVERVLKQLETFPVERELTTYIKNNHTLLESILTYNFTKGYARAQAVYKDRSETKRLADKVERGIKLLVLGWPNGIDILAKYSRRHKEVELWIRTANILSEHNTSNPWQRKLTNADLEMILSCSGNR